MTQIRRTLALTSAAFALSLSACSSTQTLPAPIAEQKVAAASVELPETKAPAMWKVADEDTTIYMFGTVHALPDDVDWYSGGIKTALDSSDVLVTEIDMTPEAMVKIQQVVADVAINKDGSTVRSVMSDEQRATYEAAMAKLRLPAHAFDQFEPWFAALSLSQVALAQAGFNPASGSEMVLERTIGDHVEREALETIEFQFGIFDTLPPESQLEFLIEGASEVDNLASYLGEVVDKWAVGDVDGVAKFMNEAFESDPEMTEALLFARNRTWAEWIDTRLDEPGTIFMAVGAGHLAGENSVQDYLSERGISTARVQ